MKFTKWLFEGVFKQGVNANKTEKEVDPNYLTWAFNNASKIGADENFRKEMATEFLIRATEDQKLDVEKFFKNEITKQLFGNKKLWILAKVIKDFGRLNQDQFVGVLELPYDLYFVKHVDSNNSEVLHKSDIRNFIQSVKDAKGNIVQSQNILDFAARKQSSEPRQEPELKPAAPVSLSAMSAVGFYKGETIRRFDDFKSKEDIWGYVISPDIVFVKNGKGSKASFLSLDEFKRFVLVRERNTEQQNYNKVFDVKVLNEINLNNKKWILATIISPVLNKPNFEEGDMVGVVAIPNGKFFIRGLKNKEFAVLDKNEISKFLKSEKDENGIMQADKFTDLYNFPGVELDEDDVKKAASADKRRATKDEKIIAKGRIPDEKLSEYQKKVEKTFLEGKKNIIISALAGTGKTTLLKHIASFKKPGEKWLYLVFNKKNAKEAQKDFPSGVDVMTSHSYLGQVLKANQNVLPPNVLKNKEIKPNGFEISYSRSEKFVDSDLYLREARKLNMDEDVINYTKSSVVTLVNLARNHALNPKDDLTEQFKKLSDINNIDLTAETNAFEDEDLGGWVRSRKRKKEKERIDCTKEIFHLSHFTLAHLIPTKKDGLIQRDHDDTLWLVSLYEDKINFNLPTKYDVVLIDEAQDFNKCQSIMLKKIKEIGSRIIAVGDENQSIYMFRGTDWGSFNNIKNILDIKEEDVHELPVNYRCGKKIIDFVNQKTKVKNLKAGLDHEGEVTTDRKYETAIQDLAHEWHQNDKKLSKQTAFIARTNQPLVSAAIDLLKQKLNFTIIGKDISSDIRKFITNIIRDVGLYNNSTLQELSIDLRRYMEEIRPAWSRKVSLKKKLIEAEDNYTCVSNIIDFMEEEFAEKNPGSSENFLDNTTIQELIDYIKNKFNGLDVEKNEKDSEQLAKKDPKSSVVLTTAHRSKGLEFERVFILKNSLFPHPKSTSKESLDEEENARYVAYTRAKDELHVLHDPGKEKE